MTERGAFAAVARLRAALAVLVAFGAPAAAQTPDSVRTDTTVYPLGSIEATVARSTRPLADLPAAVSVLQGEAFRTARPQLDLHEALRSVPGVAVDNRYNMALGTRIAIRGFGARSAFGVRGVAMLVDGIPLTLPDGQTALTNVDLATAGRIDVLRGPASVLYGNAAGGVIAITSREVPEGGLVEGRAAIGYDGTADGTDYRRFSASAGDAIGASSWFLGLSHLDAEGFRAHSAARRTGVTARVRHAPDERSVLTAVLNAAVIPVAENPGSLPLDLAMSTPRAAWGNNQATASGEAAGQAQGGLSYLRSFGGWDLEVSAHGQGRDLRNPLPFGRHIALERVAGGARALLRAGRDRPLTVTAGLEGSAQRDERLERENFQGEPGGATFRDQIDRVTSGAPFALAQYTVSRRVELQAGARFDAVRFEVDDRIHLGAGSLSGARTLAAPSGSVGALVRLGETLSAWSSLSTWFQTPTTTELLNSPPAEGETCCATGLNPELDPQTGWGGELGIRGVTREVAWEVVAFDIRIHDQILPLQVAAVPDRDFFQNAGSARNRGLEVAAGWSPFDDVDARLAYTLSDFRFEDSPDPALEGLRVPGISPHRANLGVDWTPGPYTVMAEAEFVDDYPVNDANTAENPDRFVLDLRAVREVRVRGAVLAPFVAVSNVLDQRYNSSVVINAFGGRFYEPGPGRTLLLGLTARLP